jgi:hypothetical protein
VTSTAETETHAPGRLEHALCGLSFDAHQSGDAAAPVVFAQSGELITCTLCRLEIDHVRAMFRRYRVI